MNFNFPTEETIAAVASAVAAGQGGIAIIRISGVRAKEAAKNIVHTPGRAQWKSHSILYGHVIDQITKKHIDEVLVLIMDGPKSFTGEDVVEIHCHGGLINVQRILEELLRQTFVRRAFPGEFSQRAVLNGRLNLTQAEAINDLIKARSQKAAELAMAGVDGAIYAQINQLKERLLDQLCEIEARIDFEEDLPALDKSEVLTNITSINKELKALIKQNKQASYIRNGLKVALIGLPNVGKSSLLNLLSKKEKAIVTQVPGTTRDLLENEIILEGIPITLVDSAGIRDTDNIVESIGVQRSERMLVTADIIMFIFDISKPWNESNQNLLSKIPQHIPVLLIGNKSDLNIKDQPVKTDVIISALNGNGEKSLIKSLLKTCGANKAQNIEISLNERQIDLVISASNALNRVLTQETQLLPWDFWTIDLREAIQTLGELTGDEISEALLDRIFSRFCIGK